jgi:hypothetical protein
VPRNLEPPPVETEKGDKKKLVAHEIFRNTPDAAAAPRKRGSRPQGRVSFQEYEELLSDRPEKFTAEQVNYRKAEDPGQECEHCIHFYEQVAGEKRTVCEILRLEPEASIDPEFVCDFQSRDGKEYPYQSSRPTPEGEEEEGG